MCQAKQHRVLFLSDSFIGVIMLFALGDEGCLFVEGVRYRDESDKSKR